jgi:hypothetical protein
MAALAHPSPQEAVVEKEIRSLSMPKGVRLRTVSFDTDHSGDPAVYVVFTVSKQQGFGPARIRSLGVLRNFVFGVIDNLNLNRLCYVRFVDVK